MSDSADPRIALMQKWSQENPELLAQAGLASSAVYPSIDETDHTFLGTKKSAKEEFIRLIGHGYEHLIQPKGVSHTEKAEHKKAKKKSKKGKKNTGHVTVSVGDAQFTLSTHGAGDNKSKKKSKKHHKNNIPYDNLTEKELSEVETHASRFYKQKVDKALELGFTIAKKLPIKVKPIFDQAMGELRNYKQSNVAFQDSLDNIRHIIESYKTDFRGFNIRVLNPAVFPSNREDGLKSLLIRAYVPTIRLLKFITKDSHGESKKNERMKIGAYDLQEVIQNLSFAKENLTSIRNAVKQRHEKQHKLTHNSDH